MIEKVCLEILTGNTDPGLVTAAYTKALRTMKSSLSAQRTEYAVQKCIMKNEQKAAVLKKWMESKIIASGLSFSHPIFKEDQENIDLERSRRVEFRIRTNAESKMEEILTILQSKE